MAALTFVIAESTTALGGYIEISTAAATEEPRKRVSIHEQHMILGRAGWHVPVTAMEGRSVSRLVIVLPKRAPRHASGDGKPSGGVVAIDGSDIITAPGVPSQFIGCCGTDTCSGSVYVSTSVPSVSGSVGSVAKSMD